LTDAQPGLAALAAMALGSGPPRSCPPALAMDTPMARSLSGRIGPLLVAVGCCLALAATAPAAAPVLGNILPRGGQRGTDAVVVFSGGRLSDAKEIIAYSPGFQVTKLEVVNDAQVRATIKIAPDCRLGEHAFRVRTASGLSEMRTWWVGALPAMDEKEPNSDFAAPQKIPLNVTVHGVIENEDVDYFLVECKKGQRLTAEVEALRLASDGQLFDPYVAILDMKRFELAASDDAPLLGQDAVASLLVPADGTYVVQVRDSAYGGNPSSRYRLHVGTFPRPLAVLPAGGKMGEEVEVRFLGDVAGDFTQKIKLPTTFDPTFSVFAQDANGISPSGIPFRLSEYGNVLESANNGSHATATPVPQVPAALNGVISQPGEVDHYRFTAKKGQTFDVHCYARRLGSPLDSVMVISHLNGGGIIGNDDAVGPDSYLRFTAPEDKEYVLTVQDHLKKGGPTYFYRVEFTPVAPLATLSIPKVAQYSQERQAVTVPRGNRMATLVTVTRRDFGGEVVLGAAGLPQGVTMRAETMPAGLDTIPVVFEAAAEAPVAGGLADLTAAHVDPKQAIRCSFSQVADLVIGPNQTIMWKREERREAVAVAEEVPFKIQIIEPKAPLVQNGSMNLRIVAERKPDFKAPITIIPIFNPPGVGSASSVVIPAGQNEVLLPMNAAPGAQARKWKTAVLGTATVGNGPVWVSSQLATYEVAAPFVAFQMERAASEQGKDTEIFCKIQQLVPFEGPAKVVVLGLPTKVTTQETQITKDTKELTFKVTVDKTAPAGQHRNVFCQVVPLMNGEPVVHSVGGTELRIDVPLPPKAAAVAAPAPPTANKPPEPAKPAEKRLTRLEKLRLEQEEREKSTKAGAPPKQ
jgi:hypothetical protein